MLLALPLVLLTASPSGPVHDPESGPDLYVPARRRALVLGASKYERLGRLLWNALNDQSLYRQPIRKQSKTSKPRRPA